MPSCHRSSSHIDVCESEMRQERIRPCRIVVNDERPRKCYQTRVDVRVIRPFCCFADCHHILIVLVLAALLYSIVALVLTCIHAPNPFFIVVLGYSIFTMLITFIATFTGKSVLLKVSFALLLILMFLTCAGAVLCVIYFIHNFYASFEWKWRIYMVSMLVAQIVMIFYVIALICLVAEIIAYNRRIREEVEQRTRPVPMWRRY